MTQDFPIHTDDPKHGRRCVDIFCDRPQMTVAQLQAVGLGEESAEKTPDEGTLWRLHQTRVFRADGSKAPPQEG